MAYLDSGSLNTLSVLLIALGLSADCFAIALGISVPMRTISFVPVLRTSLAFGAFQALMPVLGWLAGRTVIDLIAGYDHWVAFALLALVGSRMVWESTHSRGSHKKIDISKTYLLLALSVATSIDALAVGLTFAFLKVNIGLVSLTIGMVALAITSVGFLLGRKVGEISGKRAEIVGGIILISIGLRVLLSHIL